MTRETAAADWDGVASVVERWAALLAAGVPAAAAWRHTAGSLGEGPVRAIVLLVAEAAGRGEDAALVLARATREGSAWHGLAAVLRVSTESGAPLAPAAAALADTLRDRAELARRLEVARAGPAATVTLVTVLPALGLLGGAALGIDTVPVLLSPFGLGLLAVGGGLILLARRWMRGALRRAMTEPGIRGFDLELLALAAAGGATPGRARELLREAWPPEWPRAETEAEALRRLSVESGAPVAALLAGESRRLRREQGTAALLRVERLGVTLMLPLGVCVLPAFVLVGVVPLVVALVSSTAGLLG